MATETIRSQAASVALVALEDKIQFVEYYYGSDRTRRYIAKVPNHMAQQIEDQVKTLFSEAIYENIKTDWSNQTMDTPNCAGRHVYGLIDNDLEQSKTAFALVKIIKLMSYDQLILDCCASKLKYLVAVVNPTEAQQMQKVEDELITVVTRKITTENKKQLAYSLLGEQGFEELKQKANHLNGGMTQKVVDS